MNAAVAASGEVSDDEAAAAADPQRRFRHLESGAWPSAAATTSAFARVDASPLSQPSASTAEAAAAADEALQSLIESLDRYARPLHHSIHSITEILIDYEVNFLSFVCARERASGFFSFSRPLAAFFIARLFCLRRSKIILAARGNQTACARFFNMADWCQAVKNHQRSSCSFQREHTIFILTIADNDDFHSLVCSRLTLIAVALAAAVAATTPIKCASIIALAFAKSAVTTAVGCADLAADTLVSHPPPPSTRFGWKTKEKACGETSRKIGSYGLDRLSIFSPHYNRRLVCRLLFLRLLRWRVHRSRVRNVS